jgi:hypothetical protein
VVRLGDEADLVLRRAETMTDKAFITMALPIVGGSTWHGPMPPGVDPARVASWRAAQATVPFGERVRVVDS